MDEAKCAKLRGFTDTLAPSVPVHSNPIPPIPDPINFTTAIKEAVVAFAETKEKVTPAMKKATRSNHSWSIVFAQASVDPTTGEKVAVPTTLSEPFLNAMSDTGENRAALFQELFEETLAQEKLKRTSVGTRAKIAPGQFNKVLCTLIEEFHVMKGPLSGAPSSITISMPFFRSSIYCDSILMIRTFADVSLPILITSGKSSMRTIQRSGRRRQHVRTSRVPSWNATTTWWPPIIYCYSR